MCRTPVALVAGADSGGSIAWDSAVTDTVCDMQANEEAVPEPLADKRYSGEFRVRIPPELHRALALQAAEQGISLNRLASAKLAGVLV